jgi:hypothetical protein
MVSVFFPAAASGQSCQSIIICPQSFVSGLAPMVSDAESDGWQVDVLTIEYIETHYSGANRRDKIKAAVADSYAHGLQIVCFIGDADYSGQEPQFDIIPLWYYYSPEIGYWREDRATMIDYVDLNGDRIPDIPWTWIPANDPAQVTNLISHSLYYKAVDPGASWLGTCLWLVEDEDLDGNSGAITRVLADSLMRIRALSKFSRAVLYDSEIPCCYYNREEAAVAQIDAGVGAVFGFGTSAKRTNFVQFMSGYFYFDVAGNLAANDKCGVYFGLCCGLGEFDRPYGSDGVDFCSQFLFDPENKGASFWIAPSSNTRYYSNFYFGLALAEQLFELGARTTAEACYMALRRVMIEHSEYQEVWEGYNFFGSPFHVMHGMRSIGYSRIDESALCSFHLNQNYPNPFNPITSIEYSLQKTGHVHLRIYDVSGRLVRTLVNEVQQMGPKRVIWNGLNNQGQEASSGIYFCRLDAGNFLATRKIVLLR